MRGSRNSISYALVVGICVGLTASLEAGRAMEVAREIGTTPQLLMAPKQPDTDEKAARAQLTPRAKVLSLRLPTGKWITLGRERVTVSARGTTWHAVVAESGERAILMWWRNGRFSGLLSYEGRIYKLSKSSGTLMATPENPRRDTPSFPYLTKSADAGSSRSRQDQNPAPEVKPFSEAERVALEAKQVTIDLMMLYTRKAAVAYVQELPRLVAEAIEDVNASFRNSGLQNISLRLVRTQEVEYDEREGDHFGHLYTMVDGVGAFGSVRQLRNEVKADIVGLIVDDPSGCGLTTRVGAEADEAYFVVHHSCAMLMFSIAHEIGHILGVRHDRQTDSMNTPFVYGHGYLRVAKWRDIMSYQESCGGCPRIPYWSNPRVKYIGEPVGTDANDSARVILEQAGRVSRFR
jgi:metallopeptidase family M12-like protein